jgi:hypothetical protein
MGHAPAVQGGGALSLGGSMSYRSLLPAALVAVLASAGTSVASSMTFATFSDPSTSASDFMFLMPSDYSGLRGSWTVPGLTLQVPFAGQTFNDVKFELTTTSGDLTQPGRIDFSTSTGDKLMTVAFTSATLAEFGFGARDTVANPDRVEITYYPWGLDWNPTNEMFSFSFANVAEYQSSGDYLTATAAFSSSAIPEPTTVALLAIGCAILIRRR